MLLNNNQMAKAGILLAVNVICLMLGSIIESSTLIFLFGAALTVAIVVVETSTTIGWVFYVASCILGFVLVSNKFDITIYVMILGPYALLKEVIERFFYYRKMPSFIEVIIKLIVLNMLIIPSYFIMRHLVFIEVNFIAVLALELIFIFYDYTFGFFITYYIKYIHPKINK